jgi:hypothetical protein
MIRKEFQSNWIVAEGGLQLSEGLPEEMAFRPDRLSKTWHIY